MSDIAKVVRYVITGVQLKSFDSWHFTPISCQDLSIL